MKALSISLVILAVAGVPAMAAPGDSWILPIDHRDGGGWTEVPNIAYSGGSGWSASGQDGVRRVYWAMNQATIPTTTELYSIEFWDGTTYADAWQPIESQFKGVNGETFPIEPLIPWVGQFGTNHQYIGAEASEGAPGWRTTGPGPQAPANASFNAPGNGTYMWLTKDSWLYAKWDFPWSITRTWSELRVTQITPEPTSALLLLAGGGLLLRRRSKA